MNLENGSCSTLSFRVPDFQFHFSLKVPFPKHFYVHSLAVLTFIIHHSHKIQSKKKRQWKVKYHNICYSRLTISDQHSLNTKNKRKNWSSGCKEYGMCHLYAYQWHLPPTELCLTLFWFELFWIPTFCISQQNIKVFSGAELKVRTVYIFYWVLSL